MNLTRIWEVNRLNLKDMIQFVLDKANIPSGDRRTENLVKTSLNTAYVNFARVDCEPVEFEIELPLQVITILPDDYLTNLQLFHDALGALNDYQYRTTNGKLIIAKHIANYDTVSNMTFVYGKRPDLLEVEDDEPVINEEYHIGLCYYALMELTDDQQYRYRYEEMLGSVPPFDPLINDNLLEEYVREVK